MIGERPLVNEIPISQESEERFVALLDTTSSLLYLDKYYGTISNQLSSPIDLCSNGLVLTNKSNQGSIEDTRFGELHLPSLLNTIWGKLTDENFSHILETWLDRKISGSEEDIKDCLRILKTLANFSYLFNTRATGDNNTHFEQVHPLYSLSVIIESIRNNHLSNLEEDTINEIAKTASAIQTRIHSYLLTNGHSSKERDSRIHSLEHHIYKWLKSEKDISYQFKAENIGNYMLAAGFTSDESRAVLSSLLNNGAIDNSLYHLTLNYCLGINLIKGSQQEHRYLQNEVIDNLVSYPFVDAAEINYCDIIPQDTDILRIYAMTGTLVTHNGQAMLIRKVQRFINNNKSITNQSGNVFEVILVLPNIVPGIGKQGVQKGYDHSGSVEDRVGLFITHLHDVDRSQVLISTSFQPHPSESLRGRDRIRQAIINLSQKINEDFANAYPKRLAKHTIETVRFTGADELSWDNGYITNDQHPRYLTFANRGLVVARHEYVVPCINNAQKIVYGNGCDLIIVDDSFSTLSTSYAMGKYISEGDLSSFHPGAHPLIKNGWSQEAILKRRNSPEDISTMEVKSVTQICRSTVDKLKKFAQD